MLTPVMQLAASCAAREGAGVVLLGPPGSGKSDLVLRLLDHGFALVADDQVEIRDGLAHPPARLAGLLEVRGLGIIRVAHTEGVPVILAVALRRAERLPWPARHPALGVPQVAIDPASASAPARVGLAMDCALGRVTQLAGAFA